MEETPALGGTQSSLHLSPQACSHFQNALNLIFEYYHPSFQQCCKPRAVLQKMPGPAFVFHLCLGRVAPARLPRPGMCSGSPRTSLLLVPQLDKSVEASCSLGAGEHLEGALLQLKLWRSDNICRQEQGTQVGSAQTSMRLPVSDWEQLGFSSWVLIFFIYHEGVGSGTVPAGHCEIPDAKPVCWPCTSVTFL